MEITDERIAALAEYLSISIDDISQSKYDECTFDADGGEYMVLTDDEANEKWEESLDNYLEECIYPTLPDNMRNYFDDEKWKRDARFDGRGHSLSYYDGNEVGVEINDTWYYIFRTN